MPWGPEKSLPLTCSIGVTPYVTKGGGREHETQDHVYAYDLYVIHLCLLVGPGLVYNNSVYIYIYIFNTINILHIQIAGELNLPKR